MAVTHFEPANARRCFPCWNEPVCKVSIPAIVSFVLDDYVQPLDFCSKAYCGELLIRQTESHVVITLFLGLPSFPQQQGQQPWRHQQPHQWGRRQQLHHLYHQHQHS